MADENGQDPTADGQEPDAQDGNEQQQQTFSLDYVQGLRQEAAKYRTELKSLQQEAEQRKAEREATEKERLEKQQEFKQLYEQAQAQIGELEPYKKKYETYREQVAARNDERIEAIPEKMRTLVPEYDDPFKLAAWLDNNQSVIKKPAAPDLDGGAGGRNRTDSEGLPSESELKEMAALYGVSFEHLKQQYGIGV